MSKNTKVRFILVWVILLVLSLAGALLSPKRPHAHTLSEAMRDAVLHEANKISLFGVLEVNPAVVSGFVVTAILLVLALITRIFIIPKFKRVPGKAQLLIEQLVGFFDSLAKQNSPHRNKFLGVYIFSVGVYVFFSTVFELFGFQATTTHGEIISLPAPISDINAAITFGVMSYLVILFGGLISNGLGGVGHALKDFSLPISMSFRLFGALLSGLLVTELVYYSLTLSVALPVVVAVLFTLLHALIQTYVLTMLTALFYGEVTHPHEKKVKNKKVKS